MKAERTYSDTIGDAIDASGDAVCDWGLRSGAIQ